MFSTGVLAAWAGADGGPSAADGAVNPHAWAAARTVAATPLLAASAAAGEDPAPPDSDALPARNVPTGFAFDIGGPEAVAGEAKAIFTGEVLSGGVPSGNSGGAIPLTDFEGSVDRVILGEAPGLTVVTQQGGLSADGAELVLFEGDALLAPGGRYLFVDLNGVDGSRLLLPIVGDRVITSPAEEAELAATYEAAAEAVSQGGM